MNTTNGTAVRVLNNLYKIAEAGERGYAVAAATVKNRGFKVLFKSFAQKRAEYKEAIFAEIQRLSGNDAARPRSSVLAAIHRGRITIFAAMTIGEENIERVVLKEVLLGERVAQRNYENALRQPLPEETRALVQEQHDEIVKLIEQVQMMYGKNGKRMVIRLYDTKADADEAVRRLKVSEYPPEAIQEIPAPAVEVYMGGGPKLIETVLSGATGGSIWGTVSGVTATITIFQLAEYGRSLTNELPTQIVALIAFLGLIAAGMFVGGMLGLFLGLGVGNEDNYLYKDGLQNGRMLVQVLTDASRASPAWQLLAQVNMEARIASR